MLALLVVAITIFAYVNFQNKELMMSYSGVVKLDSASYEDLKLNNAVYINQLDAPNGRLHLRFNDKKTLNDAIGKQVKLSGLQKTVRLDNGESIWELQVNKVEYEAIK